MQNYNFYPRAQIFTLGDDYIIAKSFKFLYLYKYDLKSINANKN